MNINKQLIAVYTLTHRELVRMFRISSQVFLPPVITTLLYFLIFGSVIGNRIGSIEGISYAEFIAPGLIMMAVITNAYSNVSTSLFSVRFQRSIEEMLVSPMHYSLLLLGYTLGGVILVYITASFFIDLELANIPMTLLIVILVASLFALAGFTNGMLARTFDDVALIPTFILGPLTYLGGVFYSTAMLPPIWQKISLFNPIFYMVNSLRQAMIGHQEMNMTIGMIIICGMVISLAILNLILLKKGVGLHD